MVKNSYKKRVIFKEDEIAVLAKNDLVTPAQKKEYGGKKFAVIGALKIDKKKTSFLGYEQIISLAIAGDKLREEVAILTNAVLVRP